MRKPLFFFFRLRIKKRQAYQRQSFFDIFMLRLSGEALFKTQAFTFQIKIPLKRRNAF
jgi:hypothetical protein